MKVGDLVRVVVGATRLHPPYLGQMGVIIGPYRNEAAPHQTWFRVQVEHRVLKMHESYLKVISDGQTNLLGRASDGQTKVANQNLLTPS